GSALPGGAGIIPRKRGNLLLGQHGDPVPSGRRVLLQRHSLLAVESRRAVSGVGLQRLVEPAPRSGGVAVAGAEEAFVEGADRLHQVRERALVVVVEALEDRDRLRLALHDHAVDLPQAVDTLQLRVRELREEDARAVPLAGALQATGEVHTVADDR